MLQKHGTLFSKINLYGFINIYVFAELYLNINKNSECLINVNYYTEDEKCCSQNYAILNILVK